MVIMSQLKYMNIHFTDMNVHVKQFHIIVVKMYALIKKKKKKMNNHTLYAALEMIINLNLSISDKRRKSIDILQRTWGLESQYSNCTQ